MIIGNRTIEAFRIHRDTQVVRNEQKAIKVLGVVFVVFIVAWVPFAVLNIFSAICVSCNVPSVAIEILVWFGYVSSAINPIIYNAFNEKFRTSFQNIVMCRFDSLGGATRSVFVAEKCAWRKRKKRNPKREAMTV